MVIDGFEPTSLGVGGHHPQKNQNLWAKALVSKARAHPPTSRLRRNPWRKSSPLQKRRRLIPIWSSMKPRKNPCMRPECVIEQPREFIILNTIAQHSLSPLFRYIICVGIYSILRSNAKQLGV